MTILRIKKRPTATNSRTAVNSQPMCFYCAQF
nr:MAG TPA: deaminase [Caudoviricetes sp.]